MVTDVSQEPRRGLGIPQVPSLLRWEGGSPARLCDGVLLYRCTGRTRAAPSSRFVQAQRGDWSRKSDDSRTRSVLGTSGSGLEVLPVWVGCEWMCVRLGRVSLAITHG